MQLQVVPAQRLKLCNIRRAPHIHPAGGTSERARRFGLPIVGQGADHLLGADRQAAKERGA